MKEKLKLYIRSFFSLLRIVFIKIFNIRGFHCAVTQDFSPSARFSLKRGGTIRLKKHIHVKRNVTFEADGGIIEAGEGCFFNSGCVIAAKESVRIGSYAAFGPNVCIYDHDHDIDSGRSLHESGFNTSPVVIGSGVWIGANSVILRGTLLGEGCVVGAGSVVKGTYPPYSVITGVKAETVRGRHMPGKDVESIVFN